MKIPVASADFIPVRNRLPLWSGRSLAAVRCCSVLLVLLAILPLRAATVTWNGGSGDWSTPPNWSTGALPGINDDVVIGPGPAITITHSSGTDAVLSIQSQKPFVLSGGSLAVSSTFQADGGLTIAGGTLRGGTVVTNNGASLLVQGSGTLDGVTVNGVLDVGNTYGGALTVTNGLTLNGTALIGSATIRQEGHFYLAGTQTLGGNGTVVFGHSYYSCANTLRLVYGGTTLTIGPGTTIRGGNGYIGYNRALAGQRMWA